MPKPRDDIVKEKYFEEVQLLFETFTQLCQNAEDCKKFLKDILTDSEMRMLKRRWYIARLLASGKSIREVAHEANVSTATVARVSRVLNSGDSMLKKALEKAKPELSASSTSSSPKKYIFGHE